MAGFIAWMDILTPSIDDIPSFIVATLYLQKVSGSVLAKVNLTFTILNMTFSILGKIVPRMSAKGEEAVASSQGGGRKQPAAAPANAV